MSVRGFWKHPMSLRLKPPWCQRFAVAAFASSLIGSATARGQGAPAGVERRVDAVVAKLSADDKARLLAGVDRFYTRDVPAAGLPRFRMTDGPVGTRNDGLSTAYPAGVCLAASWDPALAEREGVALGRDARCRGDHILLGPGVNICRPPAGGPVDRPAQELKGFARVDLQPGETRPVTMTLDRRSFAHWDEATHDWAVVPGTYGLAVGRDSRDVCCTATAEWK